MPGYQKWKTMKSYDLEKQMVETIPVLGSLIRFYGFVPFLNYLRGGWQGWQYQKYGCKEYRHAIAQMVDSFDSNPKFFDQNDDSRIDITVPHV
jgi:hypothetical protein